MRALLLIVGCVGVAACAVAARADAAADAEFTVLRDAYLAKYKPLWMEAQRAWWEANTTGSDAAYDRKKAADKALVEVHSDKDVFAHLKALKEAGKVSDPVLRRELDVMYRDFLRGQADPKVQNRIVELESDVEQAFNTHRSQVGDQTLSENDVREILSTSTDSARAEAAWKGYMAVGAKVKGQLSELVRLRNDLAHELGFRDYFALNLMLQEIDEAELLKLFDELDTLTAAPFTKLKADIDAARAARFCIQVAELRPWHFGDLFFQDAPPGQEVNLNDVYKEADLLKLTRAYYDGIGLPCEDILQRSDLYEKPGKCPHAFSTDLDRAGDVRVLVNLKPNVYWADTILHEIGHSVYDKYIRPDVPFLLRNASHAITTEGIAEMFGAVSKNGEFLAKLVGVAPADAQRIGAAARATLRTERLMFSRWAQVMLRFEQGMYSQPDQDLGKLWWNLKRRYQLLSPPERTDRPDYAAKIHVVTTPVYYHSYLMGELFAAQVRHHIVHEVLHQTDVRATGFCGRPEVGTYLRDSIFGPGNLYSWNELTKRATGEPLTAKYFGQELAE